ncbi:MAG: hypothetical protein ABIR53_01860 [Paraperlucidibaca sp.]
MFPQLSLTLATAGLLLACGQETSANYLGNVITPEFITTSSARAADDNEPSEFIINSDQINESSGLARSNINSQLLWTHNDSGGETAVYAITTTGSLVASVSLTGVAVANLDWEDMTSYVKDGKSYLLVGDIGDNFAFRPTLTFYIIEEPVVDATAPGPQRLVAPVIASFQVRLPVTPRDIESIAVDPTENAAYMISKRDAQPSLYRASLNRTLPLPQGLPTPVVAEDLGFIKIPRAPEGVANPELFNWVTTMDFSASTLSAYVGTLTNGYVYHREVGESWNTAFQKAPITFPLPMYSQIEAGCFANNSDTTIFISSENLPGRLAKMSLTP